MITIIPYSHDYWVGGPPKVLVFRVYVYLLLMVFPIYCVQVHLLHA